MVKGFQGGIKYITTSIMAGLASAGTSSGPRIVTFGAFGFNPGSGQLLEHDLRIKLPGQPVQVLGMLLERPGEVVTREELQKRLWPADTFVDFEHSLRSEEHTSELQSHSFIS